MRRAGVIGIILGGVLLVGTVLGVFSPTERADSATVQGNRYDLSVLSTSGELTGPPISTLGTLISEMRSMGGTEDWTELVGVRARLVVDTDLITNNVSFWTGNPPDDILVVIRRDRRGLPSENPFGQVVGTEFATIEGMVEPLPYPEAMFSWGLTRRDVDLLEERGVYFAAYELVSTTPAIPRRIPAEQLDEWGRETAPPPGQQVETPLRLPAPKP